MKATVDGRAVRLRTSETVGSGGDASPALVLVHGAGMDGSVWSAQLDRLAAAGRRVYAVDLPAHGQSQGPPLTSPRALGRWLVGLLDAMDLESGALAGHSMGALAVLEAAARAPDRVRALALLGVAPRMPVHPDLLASARARDVAAAETIVAWGHAPEALARAAAGEPPVGAVAHVRELLGQAARSGLLHTDLAACDGYGEGLSAAARVRCPTRLVLGSMDRMTPAKAGRKLAGAIAGAAVEELPDCGHMMMTEKPEATAEALARVL